MVHARCRRQCTGPMRILSDARGRDRDPARNVNPMEAALHSAVSGAISSVISRAGTVGGSDDDFDTPQQRLVYCVYAYDLPCGCGIGIDYIH